MDKWYVIFTLPFQVALVSKPFGSREEAQGFGREIQVPCTFDVWNAEELVAFTGTKIDFPLR